MEKESIGKSDTEGPGISHPQVGLLYVLLTENSWLPNLADKALMTNLALLFSYMDLLSVPEYVWFFFYLDILAALLFLSGITQILSIKVTSSKSLSWLRYLGSVALSPTPLFIILYFHSSIFGVIGMASPQAPAKPRDGTRLKSALWGGTRDSTLFKMQAPEKVQINKFNKLLSHPRRRSFRP